MELLRNGEVVERGSGSAVLGDPLEALVWTAKTLDRYGERLRAGQVILTGALHASIPVDGSGTVEARFGDAEIGSASVEFRVGVGSAAA
jgi:2-keto-4-pentenoate hydratase